MSEIERLRQRLSEMGVIGCSVSWTPEGRTLDAEGRAACLNRAFDAIEAGDYEDMDPIGDSRRRSSGTEQPVGIGPTSV